MGRKKNVTAKREEEFEVGWAGRLDWDFPFSKVEVMKIIIFELFFFFTK